MRESRQAAVGARPLATRFARAVSTGSQRPIVTYTIIVLCLVIYGIQYLTGNVVTDALVYAPALTATEPWRMITSIFAHASILHVGLNMYSLYVIGPAVEQLLGRVRYIVLFMIAGFAGSVGVLLIASPDTVVLGASGAIFGLFGAYFIIVRRMGGNSTRMLVLIIINLVAGFIPGLNIAWQAHLGGLVGGAALAFVFLETRGPRRRWAQIALVIVVAAVFVAATVVKVELF
jgi:membrane associated rhomboid family serine protease